MINKNIRSSYTCLYGSNDTDNMQFQIHILMKESIDINAMQYAIRTAMSRFEMLRVRVLKDEEPSTEYFFERNEEEFLIRENLNKNYSLGGNDTNYYLFTAAVKENKLEFVFSYAITDEQGVKDFIQSVLFYYCQIKYDIPEELPDILQFSSPVLPDEYIDPYTIKLPENIDLKEATKASPAFVETLNRRSKKMGSRHIKFIIEEKQLMQFVKDYTNPSPILALCMAKTLEATCLQRDKDIHAKLNYDMRKILNIPNCRFYCMSQLNLTHEDDINYFTVEEQIDFYLEKLAFEARKEQVLANIQSSSNFLASLNTIAPNLLIKKQLFQKLSSTAKNNYSFSINYIGEIPINKQLQAYVSSIEILSGAKSTPITFTINHVKERFIIHLMHDYNSDEHIEEFKRQLHMLNISTSLTRLPDYKEPTNGFAI